MTSDEPTVGFDPFFITTTDVRSILASRIKKSRVLALLTQDELAHMIDLSQNVISDWERGISTPRARDIVRLSRALNVRTDYLLGLKETP